MSVETKLKAVKRYAQQSHDAVERFSDYVVATRQRILAMCFIVLFASFTTACATFESANPFAAAQSVEQKAFAMYGTYVVYAERGVAIVKDRNVPIKVRRSVKNITKRTYKPARALRDVALHVGKLRREHAAGKLHPDILKQSVLALENSIKTFRPLLDSVSKAITGAEGG